MRIFLVLHPSGNLSVKGSMTWYHNFYEPLVEIGHDVFLLRMDEVSKEYNIPYRSKKFREVLSERIISVFRKEHLIKGFDLIFTYVTIKDIEASVFQILKSFGIPLVNFSCNNTHQFHLVEGISKYFDYNLHSEKDAGMKFIRIGANPIWFPMAANPKYYYPKSGPFKYEISFIGAAYAKRAYYIKYLTTLNYCVNCFGPNWLINKPYSELKYIRNEAKRVYNLLNLIFVKNPVKRYIISSSVHYYDLITSLRKLNAHNFHLPVSDNEMISIINQSQINLGFLEVFSINNDPGEITKQHIHLREFEIPMCGGLYLTNYMDELEEFYQLGVEIETYKNEYELGDKVSFYLRNSSAALSMRRAAYLKATSCHTYQKRFNDLFEKTILR